LRRLGGTALLDKMIELFLSHVEPLVAQAAGSLSAGDLEALERAAHSIKSSAANVGASTLRSIAEQIEQQAHAGDKSFLGPLTEDLEEAFSAAKNSLERERT